MTADAASARTFDDTGGGVQQPSPPLDDSALHADGPTVSALTELEQVVQGEVELPPIQLVVPSRPRLSVRYNTNIDNQLLARWRRSSTRKVENAQQETDVLRLSATILVAQCEAVFVGEREVTEGGESLDFNSPRIQQLVGASSASDAVRKLYGVDAHVIATADELMSAAGYGDRIEQVDSDPTKPR